MSDAAAAAAAAAAAPAVSAEAEPTVTHVPAMRPKSKRRHALAPGHEQRQHHDARLKLSVAAGEVVEACATATLDELKQKIDELNNAYERAVNGLEAQPEPVEKRDVASIVAAAVSSLTPRETPRLTPPRSPPRSTPRDASSSSNRRRSRNSKESHDSGRAADSAAVGSAAQGDAAEGEGPGKSAGARGARRPSIVHGPSLGKLSNKWSALTHSSVIERAKGALQKQAKTRSTLMAGPPEPLLATPYDPQTSPVCGFLIDLDGTMYDPAGLLPGAAEFYHWLVTSGTPHVFLSNTGAKNSMGVQTKFATPPFVLTGREHSVPLANIHTAAEAQVDYMLEAIPPNAKILVVSGGKGDWRQDLDTRGGSAGKELAASWEIRTHLSENEAKAWAAAASHAELKGQKPVWVVHFIDGGIVGKQDIVSGKQGFEDWGFEIIKITSFLLAHGAQFVYTADDSFNPCLDPKFPGLVFPQPGPGMFAAMLLKLMYPHGKNRVACTGKGGNVGGKYMMEKARQMLVAQGHSGDPDTIMMVGDRFDTDVRAGLSAGFMTCLVTSGCHAIELQKFYRTDPAHHYANDVGALVPLEAREAAQDGVKDLRPSIRSDAFDPVRVLTAAFRSVDVDASGSLDLAELRILMANLGEEVVDTELEEMIHAADSDGNGTIDLDEFLLAMNVAQAPTPKREPQAAVSDAIPCASPRVPPAGAPAGAAAPATAALAAAAPAPAALDAAVPAPEAMAAAAMAAAAPTAAMPAACATAAPIIAMAAVAPGAAPATATLATASAASVTGATLANAATPLPQGTLEELAALGVRSVQVEQDKAAKLTVLDA